MSAGQSQTPYKNRKNTAPISEPPSRNLNHWDVVCNKAKVVDFWGIGCQIMDEYKVSDSC